MAACFRAVLGTGNVVNKMKAISPTSGIGLTPVFDSLNTQLGHLNFLSALGYEDRNTTRTTSFTEQPAGSWGPLEFKPNERRTHSTIMTANTISSLTFLQARSLPRHLQRQSGLHTSILCCRKWATLMSRTVSIVTITDLVKHGHGYSSDHGIPCR